MEITQNKWLHNEQFSIRKVTDPPVYLDLEFLGHYCDGSLFVFYVEIWRPQTVVQCFGGQETCFVFVWEYVCAGKLLP